MIRQLWQHIRLIVLLWVLLIVGFASSSALARGDQNQCKLPTIIYDSQSQGNIAYDCPDCSPFRYDGCTPLLGNEYGHYLLGNRMSFGTFSDFLAAEGTALREGSFSIADWSGYPANVPKPTGPFNLLEGAEYDAARAEANAANRAMHQADPSLNGLQLHEIQPVKFGGKSYRPIEQNPTDTTAARTGNNLVESTTT
jgi:hypothetical protein